MTNRILRNGVQPTPGMYWISHMTHWTIIGITIAKLHNNYPHRPLQVPSNAGHTSHDNSGRSSYLQQEELCMNEVHAEGYTRQLTGLNIHY
jgi:hypothetical protein